MTIIKIGGQCEALNGPKHTRNNPIGVIYHPEPWAQLLTRFATEGGCTKIYWFQKLDEFEKWTRLNNFHLVIMDIFRYEESGRPNYDVSMVGRIRAEFPGSRIIVTSAFSHLKGQILEEGANQFVAVPLSMTKS